MIKLIRCQWKLTQGLDRLLLEKSERSNSTLMRLIIIVRRISWSRWRWCHIIYYESWQWQSRIGDECTLLDDEDANGVNYDGVIMIMSYHERWRWQSRIGDECTLSTRRLADAEFFSPEIIAKQIGLPVILYHHHSHHSLFYHNYYSHHSRYYHYHSRRSPWWWWWWSGAGGAERELCPTSFHFGNLAWKPSLSGEQLNVGAENVDIDIGADWC